MMMFVLLWLISILTVVTSTTATVPLHARFASLRRSRRSRRTATNSHTASGLDCLLLPVVSTSCPTTSATTTAAVHRRTLTHRPDDDPDDRAVRPCSSSSVVTRSIGNTLLRGALLRIASDISGGTPLETIKTRVTVTTDTPYRAVRNIIQQENGIWSLWTGTSSRTVEGALVGAVFMLGSVVTKTQMKLWGASPTVAALAGGLVGGVAQSVVMTPAGLIFTALNADPQKRLLGPTKKGSTSGSSNRGNQENAIQVVRRVVSEKGIAGMYVGIRPMCLRQATNWASRSGFTELSRTIFQLNKYGLLGELGAGAIGGVCSCWNTPIETIRVYMQRDVSQGQSPQPMHVYWTTIVDQYGYVGLFRGVTPRAVQAIWQTVFLVVVPNLMGL
jgi:hypothetical protein